MTAGEGPAGRIGERQPAIRPDFHVYVLEDRLIHVKGPRRREDVDARFFVRSDAVVPDDFAGGRKRIAYDLPELGFDVRGRGPARARCEDPEGNVRRSSLSRSAALPHSRPAGTWSRRAARRRSGRKPPASSSRRPGRAVVE